MPCRAWALPSFAMRGSASSSGPARVPLLSSGPMVLAPMVLAPMVLAPAPAAHMLISAWRPRRGPHTFGARPHDQRQRRAIKQHLRPLDAEARLVRDLTGIAQEPHERLIS